MNKNELRKKYLLIRKDIQNKDDKSLIIFNKLIKKDFFLKAKNIGLYASKKDEVDTFRLIEYCLINNINIYLPKVIDENNMEFYKIDSIDDLTIGSFNILEPRNDLKKLEDKLDLIIVPLVVCDLNNNRIGYGKGYYDNYLKDLDIYKVGLAYKEQFSEIEIETNENDIKLDLIITD